MQHSLFQRVILAKTWVAVAVSGSLPLTDSDSHQQAVRSINQLLSLSVASFVATAKARQNPRHFMEAAAFVSAEQFQAAAVGESTSLSDGDSIASEIAPEHVTLEILAHSRQKPACSHFVARILKKSLQSN